MAVEMSPHQFSTCLEANGQFGNVITPFQPLVNPPSCITALYTKSACSILTRCSLQITKTQDVSIPSQLTPSVWIITTPPSATITAITFICPGETSKCITIQKPIHILQLPPACSATTPNFHLPPNYENSALEVNISLDMANLNMINISSVDFHIWQHLEKHQNESQLQHLASIPSVSVEQLHRHMPKAFNILHLSLHLKSQQEIQILSGHCFPHTGVYIMVIDYRC